MRRAAGPFDYWPTQRGFDRWYGFPGGYTDSWHPELYDGTNAVEVAGGAGYHLTDDLIDHAIEYVRDQQGAGRIARSSSTSRSGACHWPHQAPREYIEKYRGRYDRGWDMARREWLARQKAMGIVPADVELPPSDPEVPAWDTLTPDEQRVAARHMEVYAGFLEHTDAQIGRLVAYLEEIGQLENTLLVLISDNGASGEGGRLGAVNVDLQASRRADRSRSQCAWRRWTGSATRRPTPTTRWAGRRPATRRSSGTRPTSTAAASATR